ncbi:hypothetical protein ACNF42_01070 [Cuniculiplasma sp. SKW3]|uniref:hypothetical protein n=1 Tax=Cuniculiplasma sp. SKW3 TaxID=3400170 RepID=UPI003FD4600C
MFSTLAFFISFMPCTFEGVEMSVFSMAASATNRKSGQMGTIVGVLIVLSLTYITYLYLPYLINDQVEKIMKTSIGIIFISIGTAVLLFFDSRSSSGSFFTAAFGIAAEGIEVDLFQISSFLITGHLISAILGGILGFSVVLGLFTILSLHLKESIMKGAAVVILYTVGFVVLTSGFF